MEIERKTEKYGTLNDKSDPDFIHTNSLRIQLIIPPKVQLESKKVPPKNVDSIHSNRVPKKLVLYLANHPNLQSQETTFSSKLMIQFEFRHFLQFIYPIYESFNHKNAVPLEGLSFD